MSLGERLGTMLMTWPPGVLTTTQDYGPPPAPARPPAPA
jgi:hypothetical protein